ncbi:hypothetical protein CMV50_17560 [Escherichia coli]|nr:hypothetical protein CMV51_17680 [Escherichia coli]RJK55113.1 hypothetical protein CMV50_17560 [Escherichia coli]RJK69911.1 hypothetical protein CMV59_11165 [Escherichia coli]
MGNNLLSAKATLPVYDRNNLAPRIVHLGFGAFHRAHQACMPIFLLQNISVIGDIMRSI